MKKSEPIFELFESIRVEAIGNKSWGLLRAVEKAEKAALEEICGVDFIDDLPTKNRGMGSKTTSTSKVLNS